ncbi:MAG: DNA polymerase III subunit delta [Flammeovirgaceae bacterium]|nr:MAG: DNA polymerase III subunit delta [Flammeovirgaceae bacterium]
MDANVKKVLTELKTGKFHPVYFLQGEEPYFIDLIADYIEKNALNESERSFNQVILYGSKDVSVATVLTHARRFPMMAERQVVIVKEAQEINDLTRETGTKLLLNYLAQPVPSTVLVFCHKHKKLDGRTELAKRIEKLAVTITAKKLYESQLPQFVDEYLCETGLQASGEAVQALCEFVGNDLNRLVNEIEKIRIVLKQDELIDLDRIISQVGISKEYNIFELQKALIKRDKLKAIQIANYFEANPKKNPAIPIVAFLFSFFSKLLLASTAEDKSKTGLTKLLKISPYAIQDYSLALQAYSPLQIAVNIHALKDADLRLKGVESGSVSEGQLLRELIAKLLI